MDVYFNNRLCYLIEEFLLGVRFKAAGLTLTCGLLPLSHTITHARRQSARYGFCLQISALISGLVSYYLNEVYLAYSFRQP